MTSQALTASISIFLWHFLLQLSISLLHLFLFLHVCFLKPHAWSSIIRIKLTLQPSFSSWPTLHNCAQHNCAHCPDSAVCRLSQWLYHRKELPLSSPYTCFCWVLQRYLCFHLHPLWTLSQHYFNGIHRKIAPPPSPPDLAGRQLFPVPPSWHLQGIFTSKWHSGTLYPKFSSLF